MESKKRKAEEVIGKRSPKRTKMNENIFVQMKTCSQCGEPQEFSKFGKNGKGLRSQCKVCCSLNAKKYKYDQVAAGAKQTIARRECYEELKRLAGGCFDCHSTDRLEFAHYDRSTKYRTKNGKVLQIRELGVKAMKKEVEKGRFLCHSCHSKETEQEQKDAMIPEDERSSNYAAVKKCRERSQLHVHNVKLKIGNCFDCPKEVSETNEREFEFDHVPGREEKIDTVSNMAGQGKSIEKIDAEIKKCDLVCFGCHKIRTATRLKEKKHNIWITSTVDKMISDLINIAIQKFASPNNELLLSRNDGLAESLSR